MTVPECAAALDEPGSAGRLLPGVQRILDRVREHLGMDIGWVSAFTGGQQVIRAGSGDLSAMNVEVGEGTDAEGSFCVRVLAGTLPPVIPDARRHPVTRELDVTRALGIGSYVGAPLRSPDGEVLGMLCCLSRSPRPLLGGEAERVMSLAASLVSDHLGTVFDEASRRAEEEAARIRAVVETGAVRMVFQPVVDLVTRQPVAYEALARFDDPHFANPASAFAAATAAGLGVELELLAAERALRAFPSIPEGVGLAVNLSAEALTDPRSLPVLLQHSGRRLAVELTEHTQVHDYAAIVAVGDRLGSAGVRLVVDDAGAGYASFRHILRLRPAVIKLDIDITRDVDSDPVREALTRSMVEFARSIDAELVAEGVETESEHATLQALGVRLGQGYLYGRPGPLPDRR